MMKSSTNKQNRNKCKKVKLRKLEAKLRIAVVSGDLKRGKLKHNEKRWYYCTECRAYHTTSDKNRRRKEFICEY